MGDEEKKPEHGIMAGKPSIMRPCPFCGSESKIKNKHVKNNMAGMKLMGEFVWHGEGRDRWISLFWVGCYNPYCRMQPKTPYQSMKELAIEIWNTRA